MRLEPGRYRKLGEFSGSRGSLYCIQTTRHFIHGTFLISIPTGDVPVECIQTAVLRGSNFWALGLRALYFATTLLLWIFGPIPMFVGSVVTVIILHCLDINKEPMIQYGSNS